MKEATEREYERIYNQLIKDYVGDEPPTARRLSRALKAKAEDGMSKGYFYRLKSACIHMQKKAGYPDQAEKLSGLATWPKGAEPLKKGFARKVSDTDYQKLMYSAKEDAEVKAAIFIAKHTGMRPDEMYRAVMDGNGNIAIDGAKKSEELKRGADRFISLKDESLIDEMRKSLNTLRNKDKGVIQSRIDRLTRKVFPKRKHPPTLKTFRHQLGSELKALIRSGDITAKEAAYVLGHQSADSMLKYGNIRCSGQSAVSIKANGDYSQVREPSAEFNAVVNSMTDAQKSESSNVYATAREMMKPVEIVKDRTFSTDYENNFSL